MIIKKVFMNIYIIFMSHTILINILNYINRKKRCTSVISVNLTLFRDRCTTQMIDRISFDIEPVRFVTV